MEHFKIFINLTRLNKPIGFMLLFWPCSWGLAYAYKSNQDLNIFLYYLLLFFLGSILMRSAGCIINDIVDRDIDKKVQRTKNRPIASKKINVFKSLIYAITLCLIAFLILVQFNFLTILLGLTSMFLAFSYPFMKRITYWPQLFLGLTFNWGIIMAYTSINNIISLEAIILYSSAIFWTLGYDTIYGAQDIVDDEIIGMKSTSIKFKNNIKKFVSLCYLISSILILFLFPFNMSLQTLLMIFFISTLVYQILIFNKKKPKTCLKAFKINNISGLILFVAILSLSFNKGIL
ncbi:4-hydroxybenzoate octaprenyltransferase [Pelagibacteraceae bacterium]|nr:4-hydroxybenzoate octaprenyltransferase [Pelagibacteraceae bacterium]